VAWGKLKLCLIMAAIPDGDIWFGLVVMDSSIALGN
jgi:hypothetical protein